MIDRVCRRLVSLFLRRMAAGSLIVLEDGERSVYGAGLPAPARLVSPLTVASARA